MKVPKALQNADRSGAVVRTFEYDDGSVIAVDFGHAGDALTVDILGSTAIVVTDGEQFEFELPPEATDVSVQNGVLTIEE
ncbi:DUF7127 family protein [Halosolutus gelatinilyticus]|uniref:DUF7127 family protein n=1 Tax=Halosolutus gelatinilyticus TaxID=2931975 RepID=UPI001FF602FA|nr:hypothetical protein [Halosolutus gelatinilyticus]